MKAWQKTPAAAYVDDDAPALADPMLRQSWKKNRRALLLQSTRRVGLDLELVPHGDYRNELAKKPIPSGAGSTTGGAILIGTFTAPAGSANGASSSSSSSGEGGGGGVAMLAAAAAALLLS